MENKEILEKLQQSWVHSHEEDTENEMVYRPADYDFPLSRGRAGFELKPDHKLVELSIAPTDVYEEEAGSWELEVKGDNDLTLELNTESTSPRKLHVKAIENDRLIVEKD